MPELSLLSAGSNPQGQLGIGNDDDAHRFAPCIFSDCPPGTLPPGTLSISHIACGANHTLALLTRADGPELWGCGDGRKGQLGPLFLSAVGSSSSTQFKRLDLGRRLHASGLERYTMHLIAAGWETSYVVLSHAHRSDVLISMGGDDYGNLGIGGVKRKPAAETPFHVVDLHQIVAPELTDEDYVITVQSLMTGPHHVVIQVELTLQDGSSKQLVAGWGAARHGQLGGAGHTSPRFHAIPHLIPLNDRDLDLGLVTSVALGNQHSVFLHASGRLSGLGSDRKSQLRDLETLTTVHSVGCTWHGTYAVVQDASGYRVIATGSHTKGQLGRVAAEDAAALAPVTFPFSVDTHKLVKIACGSEHVLCLFGLIKPEHSIPEDVAHTEVWGWGWNEHGNLGIGSTEDVHIPVRVWPPDSEHDGKSVDVWCGNGTSWIVVQK